MSWTRLRIIKSTPETQNSIAQYREVFARFNDMWAGLQWLLARNPEPIGDCYTTTLGETEYLLFGRDGDFAAGIPDIWVMYTYTDDEILIHDLFACEAKQDDLVSG